MTLIILPISPITPAMFGRLYRSPVFIIRVKIDAAAKVIMMKTNSIVRRTQLEILRAYILPVKP